MAVDKLVDSTQLDSDLTSVANAIRTKGGTSAQMAFPAGFVSAVQNIPTGITPTGTKQISITQNGTTTEDVAAYANAEITVDVQGGGGYTLADIASGAEPSGAVDLTGVVTINYAFRARPNIASVYGVLGTNAQVTGLFQQCTALTTAHIEMSNGPGGTDGVVQGCTALTTLVFLTSGTNDMQGICNGCTNLVTADIAVSRLRNNTFAYCTKLATLILRGTTMTTLDGAGALGGSSFKSGGAGGTIYIPKALYDHLGDGTSLDYKAAPNWSTFDGYGTITWAQIEGSYYETHYADGTPIN